MKLKYADKVIKVKPYCTKQEKELLLYASEIDEAIEILSDNFDYTEELTYNEKVLILWKLREISIGEMIPIKYKCQKCSRAQEAELDITGITSGGTINNFKDFELKESFSEDLEEYVVNRDILDELETSEYDELMEYISTNKVHFNFIRECTCHYCSHNNTINISGKEMVLAQLSETDLAGIYRLITELVYHGNYTKADVESMIPFEREIFVGLLTKIIEDKNKK